MEQETPMNSFETKMLPEDLDYLAPDGSEIRLLPNMVGRLCHCTLPPWKTSSAVKHKSVEEIWYFIQGRGQVWRRIEDSEMVVDLQPSISLTIPTGTHFQFRNTGSEPLCFVIATIPPWPGPDEAVAVDDHWQAA